MLKLVAAILSFVVSLGLATMLPTQPPPPDGPPPPKAKGKDAKKKKGHEPGGELSKAYDLLRRLRADGNGSARSEERLRDWTDRAAGFYRDGLRALNAADPRLAREYAAAAHDLARAVDHARNAVRFDRPDPDLPAPSDDFGLDDTRERARRDLYRAYERLQWLGGGRGSAAVDFYTSAARDLYSAGRRDLEAGRDERAGELARAAEAMTHVPEHLAQTLSGLARKRPEHAPVPPPAGPDAKTKPFEPVPRRGFDLPQALPPGI
jgi:hypothetical protein